MIFYFTGTGNSLYIAKKIASITGDTLVSINDKIKRNNTASVHIEDRLVFVVPTYGWRIPRVVEHWIRATQFSGMDQVWFVMNCGSEIGNAAKYNRRLCNEKGFSYMGTAQIVMPENYIAMFSAPAPSEAKQIIDAATPVIDTIAQMITNKQVLPAPRDNLYDRFMSSAVNPIFYRLFVKANRFYADNRCVSCGTCVELCPLNNISLSNGKPIWGKDCTHCMACICRCPVMAIEYGKKSVGKHRYLCSL